MRRWPRWLVCAAVLGCVLAGCQAPTPVEGGGDIDGSSTPRAVRSPDESGPGSGGSGSGGSGSDASGSGASGSVETTPEPTSPDTPAEATEEPQRPARFEAGRAMLTVRRLAGRIGPREATTRAYRRAARAVGRRFADLGYDVRRQRLRVPEGVSWGVPVPAGRTWNVVAAPQGFRPRQPHLLVGAHLDTVPQAPGAEDNASGVAVLVELARLAARDRVRLPVVFVAFAAEEPRGDGDALHHFGSRAYVARMSAAERRALQAMVSLDRVGVGRVVPICTGGLTRPKVKAALARHAQRLDIPVQRCSDNQSSDHWSFEKAGELAARLGSTPYAGYHSARDVPAVVNPAQLRRAGRVAWAWLSR